MKPVPSTEAIIKALEQAQAMKFINEKPDKLQTMIGPVDAPGFSGGQMQRLAIARVLIRNPDVILLDEATAALDPITEREVQDTLDRAFKGFTTLAIAHRLTTIKDADKIIVFDKGCKVEEGPHNELLKIPIKKDSKGNTIGGFYHNQWDTQFQEKGLSTSRLNDKIQLLEEQIKQHKATISHTQQNMRKFRTHATAIQSVGHFSPAPPA